MKITHITGYYPLSSTTSLEGVKNAKFGGVERYIYQLTKEQARKNEVTILSSDCGDLPAQEQLGRIKIKRAHLLFEAFRTPILPTLPLEILKEDADVFHIHATYPFFSEIAVLLCKLKRKPVVLTYHFDGVAYGTMGAAATFIYYKTLGKLMGLADRIIATTGSYAEASVFLKGRKVDVVPIGIDSDAFKRVKVKKKGKTVLFLGRLVEYKGLEYLIAAMRIVQQKIDAKLVIAGDGPLKSKMQKLSEGLNVEFKGFVSEPEKLKLYSAADVFVLPSVNINEAYGITALEAMACEVPVIASDLAGVREALKDAAILVEPGNPQQLSEEILRVLQDKALAKNMARKGRKKIETEHDWSKIAGRIEGIYEELLQRA